MAAPYVQLIEGPALLEDVLDNDDDMLAQMRYPQQKNDFSSYLMAHSADIEELVRYHLGVNWCHVCVMEYGKREVSMFAFLSPSLQLAVEDTIKSLYAFHSHINLGR